MSQALYMPDELYQRLVEVARARGQSPDELLRALLSEVIESENNVAIQPPNGQDSPGDPLAPFIGAFHFGVGDLAARHDAYLAFDQAGFIRLPHPNA